MVGLLMGSRLSHQVLFAVQGAVGGRLESPLFREAYVDGGGGAQDCQGPQGEQQQGKFEGSHRRLSCSNTHFLVSQYACLLLKHNKEVDLRL